MRYKDFSGDPFMKSIFLSVLSLFIPQAFATEPLAQYPEQSQLQPHCYNGQANSLDCFVEATDGSVYYQNIPQEILDFLKEHELEEDILLMTTWTEIVD